MCMLMAARTVGGSFSFPCLECMGRPQYDRLESGSNPWCTYQPQTSVLKVLLNSSASN